jgi:hypothetical protein
MAHHPTRSSRLATVALALLSATLLARVLLDHHRSYVDVILLAVVVLLAPTTVKLHRDHCLESRVSAMALSLLCAAGVVLASVAGVPGQPHERVGISAIATLALSSLVLGLLAVDHREQTTETGLGSPYAS